MLVEVMMVVIMPMKKPPPPTHTHQVYISIVFEVL